MATRPNRTQYVPPKGCRYCGKRDVLVRQTSPAPPPKGTWAIFDTAPDGTATAQHRCQAGTIPASRIAAANVGATHCGGTCGNATCPDVIAAGATINATGQAIPPFPTATNTDHAVGAVVQAATDALAGEAFDMDAVYAALADYDEQERRRREPAHERRESTYAATVPDAGQDADGADVDGITVYRPRLDRDYLADVSQLAAIRRVIARADRTGTPQNVGLFGDAGSGKSTLGIQIAAMRRGIAVVCEAAQWQTPDEVYAQTTGLDRESGNVIAHPSQFVRGIETPGATVIVNDIANVQNVKVQNGLNELLDPSTRATYVAALGRSVRVAPGVVIVGTWNTNTISASELSGQILSRFRSGCMMEVPFPNGDTLAAILSARTGVNTPTARKLADFADWMRNDPDPIPVDMRGMISAAMEIVDGATIGAALRFTVLSDMDESERTRAYTIIATNTRDADEREREAWTRPVDGTYAALSDVFGQDTGDTPDTATDAGEGVR